VFNVSGENCFVGPGSYENLLKKGVYKANFEKENKAGFNQSELKHRVEEVGTPGPGSYQVFLPTNQQFDIHQ
jgi:hypothetical protein